MTVMEITATSGMTMTGRLGATVIVPDGNILGLLEDR
jgi:hypothetical protein